MLSQIADWHAYGQSRPRCAELIDGLLDARELRVGSDTIVRAAAAACRRDGADFADAVIAELGRVAGCEHTMTFDRRAARGGHMRNVTMRDNGREIRRIRKATRPAKTAL